MGSWVEIIGNRFENLEDLNRKKNEIKQWTAEELEEKIIYYQQKIKTLTEIGGGE